MFFFYTNYKFYSYSIGHVATMHLDFRFVFTINLCKMIDNKNLIELAHVLFVDNNSSVMYQNKSKHSIQ